MHMSRKLYFYKNKFVIILLIAILYDKILLYKIQTKFRINIFLYIKTVFVL